VKSRLKRPVNGDEVIPNNANKLGSFTSVNAEKASLRLLPESNTPALLKDPESRAPDGVVSDPSHAPPSWSESIQVAVKLIVPPPPKEYVVAVVPVRLPLVKLSFPPTRLKVVVPSVTLAMLILLPTRGLAPTW